MTSPEDPTRIDPGRGPADGAARLVADEGTALDPGRTRRFDEPHTALDPGRERLPGRARTLPAELSNRFEVVEELTGNGRQGEVFSVRERATGNLRVLKVHHRGPGLDEHVSRWLGENTHRHIVAVPETGAEEGRPYEVMEHVHGGTLLGWRTRHPSGVDSAVLTELVRQLASGLTTLHEAQIVHRDLKPSNVLVRGLEPLDVVIADLGISCHVPGGESYRMDVEPSPLGTVPYSPPEYLGGRRIRPAYDWWSLGMLVMELAGAPFLDGTSTDIRQSRICTRPVQVDGLNDERITLLCRGLLAMDPQQRWSGDEVAAWLRGESPAVADLPAPTRSADPARAPYVFLSEEYRERDLLATVLTRHWNTAREHLFNRGSRPRRQELLTWLEQFPDAVAVAPAPRRSETDDVHLLHLLRRIDPAHPPMYRERNITRNRLAELAQQAIDDEETSREIVTDLWRADLLPLLATGSEREGLGGGDGLGRIHERWHAEHDRLLTLARGVTDLEARYEAVQRMRDHSPFGLALALLAVTANDQARNALADDLAEADRRLRLPWFSWLVARPEFEWVAYALRDYAEREARRIEDEERGRRAHEEWLRRTALHRESSRRLNRPMALGYAVTGVAVLAVALFGLVVVSDEAEIATDAQIVDAWLASVVALAVTLMAESLLAWDAGGRFHPAYSFLGAGRIALGRVARRVLVRRMATPAVLVTLAVLGALTVFLPMVTPFALAALNIVWTVRRHMAWREQDRRELAIVNGA